MNYKIFEIEKDPSILSFRNEHGDPIWMFMRYTVMYNIMSKYLFNTAIVNQSRPKGVKSLTYLIKALAHNFKFHFKRKSARVIFYSTSRGIIKEGKYLNQYIDQYALLLNEDCMTIEHPPLDFMWYPKRYNNNVIYNAPNLLISSAFIRVSHRDVNEINNLISFVSRQILSLFGFSLSESDRAYIFRATSYEMSRIVTHSRWLLKQIKAHNSRLVIIVGGSYSRYIPIIRLLRSNGIKTADLQHGYITSTNTVYNYAPTLLEEDDIINATPDYLLTYGEWWSSQSNLPYQKKVVVGNPYRNEMASEFNHNKHRGKVVIIGCARNTLEYMQLAENVHSIFREYEVVFRPHPTERYEAMKIYDSRKLNYTIDYQSDLYQLLEDVEMVISEISTVLFESVGLVPRIIVWRTEYSKSILPDSPFEKFSNIRELIELINSGKGKKIKDSEFWNVSWKTNFEQFIQDTLGSVN